ncbi:hypothetical protein GCM10027180_16200 [Microbulbifer echini]
MFLMYFLVKLISRGLAFIYVAYLPYFYGAELFLDHHFINSDRESDFSGVQASADGLEEESF